MSNLSRTITCLCFLAFATVNCLPASAQNGNRGARERLIGAWHLVRIDAPGPDGKSEPGPAPKGMLIYTRDGHMSVQLMYPRSSSAPSNEYVLNGYEASFGSYNVDESAHIVTHHVQGSITGDLLVGKDLPRKFEFSTDGRLLMRSTRPDEHWSVTWEHD
jgi:Lipocalin-like domain